MASGATRSDAGRTPSNRSVNSSTAASPPSRTTARISFTAASGPSAAWAGRGSRPRRSRPAPRRSSRFSTSAEATGANSPPRNPIRGASPLERPSGAIDAPLRRAQGALHLEERGSHLGLVAGRGRIGQRSCTVGEVGDGRGHGGERSIGEQGHGCSLPGKSSTAAPKGGGAATPGGGSRRRVHPGWWTLVWRSLYPPRRAEVTSAGPYSRESNHDIRHSSSVVRVTATSDLAHRRTEVREHARLARWPPGEAHPAPVQDDPQAEHATLRCRHHRAQRRLHLHRVGLGREAQPLRQAQHVRVDRQAWQILGHRRTTFAVLRPTPGTVTQSRIERGTSPP
jgi:hypothetical protein